jgi:hypothetical protein
MSSKKFDGYVVRYTSFSQLPMERVSVQYFDNGFARHDGKEFWERTSKIREKS